MNTLHRPSGSQSAASCRRSLRPAEHAVSCCEASLAAGRLRCAVATAAATLFLLSRLRFGSRASSEPYAAIGTRCKQALKAAYDAGATITQEVRAGLWAWPPCQPVVHTSASHRCRSSHIPTCRLQSLTNFSSLHLHCCRTLSSCTAHARAPRPGCGSPPTSATAAPLWWMISSLQVRNIVLRLCKRKDNQNCRTCLLLSASLCCAGLKALLPPCKHAVAPSVGNSALPRPPSKQAGPAVSWLCASLRLMPSWPALAATPRCVFVEAAAGCVVPRLRGAGAGQHWPTAPGRVLPAHAAHCAPQPQPAPARSASPLTFTCPTPQQPHPAGDGQVGAPGACCPAAPAHLQPGPAPVGRRRLAARGSEHPDGAACALTARRLLVHTAVPAPAPGAAYRVGGCAQPGGQRRSAAGRCLGAPGGRQAARLSACSVRGSPIPNSAVLLLSPCPTDHRPPAALPLLPAS